MPKPVDYDLSQISAHVITYSDRIQRGTKEDRATPACTAALAEAGLGPVTVAAIPESADILETEIRDALEAGARFVLDYRGRDPGHRRADPRPRPRQHPPVGPVPRGRRRDGAGLVGGPRRLLPRLARRRARHSRGGHAAAGSDLPPARRTALTLISVPLPLSPSLNVACNLALLSFLRYRENVEIPTFPFQSSKG